jgi:membrane associated rhomboid family serine protease
MLPLSDGLPARRFPIVNVSLIVGELRGLALLRAAAPELVDLPRLVLPLHGRRQLPRPGALGISWITAMFLHGSWDHILGNMLFLAIFGKNVEDAFGTSGTWSSTSPAASRDDDADGDDAPLRHRADARVPNLGASGAIAAVLGAYFVLYPELEGVRARHDHPVRISAWFFLGFWFLYQLVEANFGIFGAKANGGGVAFFAHVGGFVFGAIVAWLLLEAGRISLSRDARALGAPA